MKSLLLIIAAALIMKQIKASNMFNEYFKRGMYECALDYLKNFQEIHRLFKKASIREQECIAKAAITTKTFPMTKIAPLDEYIDRMRQEEEEAKSMEGSLLRPQIV